MYAAIDIGTNSVRLLLYEESTGKKKKWLTTTRIGQGLAATGRLSDDGMDRTEAAVVGYFREAVHRGAKLPVFCYATSAVREAQNGAAFMGRFAAYEGLLAEIIPGEMEAGYGFNGAAHGGSGVVLDIGGGSTELIYGEQGKILSSRSIVLGCVSSLERFLHSDPPKKEELSAMSSYLRERAEKLCRSVLGEMRPEAIIGIGGTATQLAMIKLGLQEYDPDAVNGLIITREELSSLYESMAAMPLSERRLLAGMDPNRADVIVSGAAIALEILDAAHCGALSVCDDDGLDGYLMAKTQDNG